MTRRFNAIYSMFFLLAMLLPLPHQAALAQSADTVQGQTSANPAASQAPQNGDKAGADVGDLVGWNFDLERMEKALTREGNRDRDFSELQKDAQEIQNLAQELLEQTRPRLVSLNEQFEQLGPAPADDQPVESEVIAIKRTSLAQEISEVDGVTKAAQLLIVKARQIRFQILDIRRSQFLGSITSKSFAIYSPKLWVPFAEELRFFGKRLGILFANMSRSMSRNLENTKNGVLLLFGGLTALLIILYLTWRFFGRFRSLLAQSDASQSNPANLALAALLNIAAFGVVPAMAVLGVLGIIVELELASPSHIDFLFGITFALVVASITLSIASAFLRPGKEGLRIVQISTDTATRIMVIISMVLLFFVVSRIVFDAGRAIAATFEFGIAVKSLYALTTGVLAANALLQINRGQQDGIHIENTAGLSIFLNWNVIRTIFWGGITVIFVSLLAGYAAMAEFAANQIILSSAVLAMLWLLLKIVDDNIAGRFQASHAFNQKVSAQLGWNRKFTEQVGVILTGLLRLSVILLTLLVLMIPWGIRARDWVEWLSTAFFGFNVGSINVSFSVMLSSVLVFFVAMLITRTIKHWLTVRFLPTTRLDIGIRNSITTVFGYVGVSIAAGVAISYAGFNLSSLAYVAGALSVGIGFGLQSVVNNFVSGLILLVERPIKAGDWIVTAGGEGTVKKISVRSTEIETFDRATVIVPNATLISDAVTNWNHKNSMGRVRIAVGVDYSSDPQKVEKILLACAENHEGILENPSPLVYFMDFGESSLDFELRCYLADVGNGMRVKSDLRYAVFSALSRAGITIPFPQRDIHIKGLDSPEAKTSPVKKILRQTLEKQPRDSE